MLAAIALGLELKFGAEGVRFYPKLEAIVDTVHLRAIYVSLKTAVTLAEVAKVAAVEGTGSVGIC